VNLVRFKTMTNPSDDLQQRLGETERSLIDERAERDQAQRKAARLAEDVQVWRRRAEERAERIVQLEEERDRLRTARGWLWSKAGRIRTTRVKAAVLPVESAASVASTRRLPPSIPGVSIASNVTGSIAAILAEGNVRDLASRSWDAADIIVADPSTMSSDEHSSLASWLSLSSRPPTVVVAADPRSWKEADLVICSRVEECVGGYVPPPIDTTAADFTGDSTADVERLAGDAGIEVVLGDDGSPIGVVGKLGRDTTHTLTQIAARGIPVGDTPEAVRADGAGQLARRWAWRERDPAVLLSELLDRVGVRYTSLSPRVAGVLISNRPIDLIRAIGGFASQEYPDKELVVGCHGIETEPVERFLEENHADLPVQVLSFASALSLGSCLNAAIEATSAPVVAKIDDDDHYGPAYLTDAVNAMRYSGALVIGKAAQFTYVQSVDRTVLRRADSEETFVDGTLTGATLVFRRHVWEAVGFPDRPRKVDVYFLDGVRAAGYSVYANSRWEFVYLRRASGHTWQADDSVFLSGSQPAWDGWNPSRADL